MKFEPVCGVLLNKGKISTYHLKIPTYVFSEQEEMRQLKGKPKENAKEKKERKKEFAENREKAFSIGDHNFLID